jgi:hypothetical protein
MPITYPGSDRNIKQISGGIKIRLKKANADTGRQSIYNI